MRPSRDKSALESLSSRFRPIIVLLTGGILGFGLYRLRVYSDDSRADVQPQGFKQPSSGETWRTTPLAFEPDGDLRDVIERAQVRRALLLLQPDWRAPKANVILHSLRLWGKQALPPQMATSVSRSSMIGPAMLNLVLDQKAYRSLGVIPDDVYYRTEFGVGVLYSAWGPGGVAHCNQLLKVLGEIGVAGDTPLLLDDGRAASVSDLFADALKRFSAQDELEFSAVAFSRWLPPMRAWRDRHGEPQSLDELAIQLARKATGQGACTGAHLPYAVVNLLRMNDVHSVLDPPNVRLLESKLRDICGLLEQNQHKTGFWFDRWFETDQPSAEGDAALQAVTATGHHLEWIALAPKHLRPNRGCVQRAAQALANAIVRTDAQSIVGAYQPFSHAVRALVLLRAESPATVLGDH